MGLAFFFRCWRALTRRRRPDRRDDWADMGTAFGLEAIAALEPSLDRPAPAVPLRGHLERRSFGRFAR